MKIHPFFGTIDWQKLYDKEIKPPFIPAVSRSDHTAYFDKEFTTRTPEGIVLETFFFHFFKLIELFFKCILKKIF